MPSQAVPGSDGYIELKISNVGTASIESVKIKTLRFDKEILQKGLTYLDDLSSLDTGKSTSAIIKFSVPSSAPPGYYSAQFIIQACQSSSCKDYVHDSLIVVQSPSILDINLSLPEKIRPGEISGIVFHFSNKGSSAINNLVFVWSEQTGTLLPKGSDNRISVEELMPGRSSDVPVSIVSNPDAKSGLYSIKLNAIYTDNIGVKHEINSTTGVLVSGDFNFIATIESQDIIAAGRGGSINIKISNAGTENAQFLFANATKSDFTGVLPESVYIGNLKSDDYDTEKFYLMAPAKAGSYPFKLTLIYSDIYGKKYSEEKQVYVVVSESKTSYSAEPFTVVLVVIIVLLAAYFRIPQKTYRFIHGSRNRKK